MRYLGSAYRKGSGEDSQGHPTRPLENKLLGLLERRLKVTGQTSGFWRKTLRNGTRFLVAIDKSRDPPFYYAKVADDDAVEHRGYLIHMDSGFVLPTVDGGSIWQSPHTRNLYQNYIRRNLAPKLGPVDPVDHGASPKSFVPNEPSDSELDDKLSSLDGNKPGNYTGKLKWLIAGQLGLKCDDTFWVNRDTFFRDDVAIGRLSGEGIYTDGEGVYWFLDFDHNGSLSGTATKLFSPLQYKVKPENAVNDNTDFQRQIETHVLAIATRTTDEIDIVFSGDVPIGAAFAYGWHFSRNGRQAVIVANERETYTHTVGASTYTYYHYWSRKYVATIEKVTPPDDDEYISFVISKEAETYWYLHPYVTLWTPFESLGVWKQTVRYSQTIYNWDSFSAIIYAFYDEDDVIQDCVHEYKRDTIPDDFGSCHPYTFNGINLTASNSWPGGTRDTMEVVFGDERVSIISGPIVTGIKDASWTYSLQNVHVEVPLVCHVGGSEDLGGYAPPCPDSGYEPIWNLSFSPVGCKITRKYDWVEVVNSRQSWTQHVNHGKLGGLAIIFPLDCADGVVALSEQISGSAARYLTASGPSTYIPSTGTAGTHAWKVTKTVQVDQCPGYVLKTCEQIGTHVSPQRIIHVVGCSQDGATTEEKYTLTTSIAVKHRNGVFRPEVFTEETDFILNASKWASWVYRSPSSPPASIADEPMTVWQGGTAAMKFFDGFEYHLDAKFPSEAEVVIGWA